MPDLSGKKVAILAANGFEEVELTSPREALEKAGAECRIVSPANGQVEANRHREHGIKVDVDDNLDNADASTYDALLIPGGLFSPDALRVNEKAKAFARSFFEQEKPVFSICHGPQLLISADLVEGRAMTGFGAIQKDLENAGARVSDEAVVVDKGLVTSRSPHDLDAFNAKIVEELGEGKHAGQRKSVA